MTPETDSYGGVGAHNYCRAGNEDRLWCYTVDPEVKWEYCEPKQYHDFNVEQRISGNEHERLLELGMCPRGWAYSGGRCKKK